MKNNLTILILTITLFLSGCNQKTPNLNGSSNNISDANTIADGDALSKDTVTIDESPYGNGSTGSYNSSSDGFKSLYFEFGEYTISPDMQESIKHNMAIAMQKESVLKLEGNCDEFGTDEYNYALGLKRAKAVKDSLVAQGLAPNRTLLVTLGESNPVCTEPSDSCYQRNRRVDIRFER